MTGYIFNRNNLTVDDKFIIIRRSITCFDSKATVRELGNDYCEQTWYGDITGHPGYEEYDEVFKVKE